MEYWGTPRLQHPIIPLLQWLKETVHDGVVPELCYHRHDTLGEVFIGHPQMWTPAPKETAHTRCGGLSWAKSGGDFSQRLSGTVSSLIP